MTGNGASMKTAGTAMAADPGARDGLLWDHDVHTNRNTKQKVFVSSQMRVVGTC